VTLLIEKKESKAQRKRGREQQQQQQKNKQRNKAQGMCLPHPRHFPVLLFSTPKKRREKIKLQS
jgi:hypothetical protein